MAEETQNTPAQSATEKTSAQGTATSTQQQPEQRNPSTTPVAPEQTPSDPTPAANGDDEIRDPTAYARAQEEKYQRLLDKKAKELEDSQSKLTQLEARLKTMEESQRAEFQTQLDELKANNEKERQETEAARKEAEDARIEALRVKVAVAAGLPLTFADRLKGSTEDELKADADKLLADFPKQSQQPSANSPLGNRAGGKTPHVPTWRDHGTAGFGDPGETLITGG